MPSVKQAWIRDYGEQIGLQMWQQHKKIYGKTNKYFQQKYGKQYVQQLSKKKHTFSLQSCIERYGLQLGPIKWNERLSKKLKTQEIKKQNGFRKNNKITLADFQQRYGEEEGYRIWDKKRKSQAYKVSRQRYIEQFGEQKGRQICRQIKDNLSLDSFIRRFGQQQGIRKYDEFVFYHPKFPYGYSIVSQELFWNIYNSLQQKYKINCCFFELNNEQVLYVKWSCHIPLKPLRVDFKCGSSIIEFDGSYWHKNRKQEDEKRDTLLFEKGYKTLRIDEKFYYKNKQQILEQCLRFIHENSQI